MGKFDRAVVGVGSTLIILFVVACCLAVMDLLL